MKIGQEQQILVEVGELEFCIDLDEVLSIVNPPKMVRLPSARGAFIRAFKYQDELGAAVSMRVKFALPERENMSSGQLLLGYLNGRLAGFWFDRVVQILKIGDGAEWFPIPANTRLPSAEFDTFVRYRQRLIPHTSLMGLLRFEQAEAWKSWVAEQKPRLEAAALEDEAAAEAPATPAAQPAGEEDLISMDEFYALMDEAGVGEREDFAVAEPELVATVANPPEATRAEGLEMPGEAAPESRESEARLESPEEPLPLAVPVNPAESEAAEEATIAYQLAVGEAGEQESLEPEPPAEVREGEDALFSLERKREDIRRRMNPGGNANLGDYSIIKVDGSTLLSLLRRWLKRSLLLALLLLLAYGAVQGRHYQKQRGLVLGQLWVHGSSGQTDWSATAKALGNELGRFWGYLRRHPDPRR